MAQAISGHNKKLLSKSKTQPDKKTEKLCNCRKQAECPLSGRCLEESVIYKADVTSTDGRKCYIGSTEGSFKKHFTGHKASLTYESKNTSTSLSKYIWELKSKKTSFEISWSVIAKCPAYKCGTRHCDLCLSEKYYILKANEQSCLNKNSELLQKCRHINKYKLGKVT